MALSKAIAGMRDQGTLGAEAQMCKNRLTIALGFEHLGDDFAGLQPLCFGHNRATVSALRMSLSR